ncbi:MAG: M48 family metalloprotease [Lewinellaceae bacterium]|nr:M48 family metalloprotease [Lewinellaceae bacterium]
MTSELPHIVARALGWTVLHSLWQITLIWLAFKILSKALHRRNESLYLLSLAAMAAGALWAAISFVQALDQLFQQQAYTSSEVFPMPIPVTAIVTPETATETFIHPDRLAMIADWLGRHAVQIGWAWGLCALLLYLRLLGGYYMAHRLQRKGVTAPDTQSEILFRKWVERLGIAGPVRLLQSSQVAEPLTLGFWKPVVLFPVGMLTQLTPAQAEALLLHELAHIRRHDYLVNLLQLLLEVLFFYHPLFWLLSKEARTRREYCCDDLVVAHTADPLIYAQTLTNLQLSLVNNKNPLTMNATGNSRFAQRIMRIAGITPKRSSRSPWPVFFLLPAIVAMISWWPAARATEADSGNSIKHELPVASTPAAAPDSIVPKSRETAIRPAENNPAGPASPDDGAGAVSIEPLVVAETEKMNVFYIGVDNPIAIAAPGYDCTTLSVRLLGAGELTPTGDCRYNVKVRKPGEVGLNVYHRDKLVGSRVFRVKRIPSNVQGRVGEYPATGEVAIALQATEAQLIEQEINVEGVVAIQAINMNVLYIGVDNPVHIAASGVPSVELSVRLNGEGEVTGSDGNYTVRVKRPGKVMIQVYRNETLLSEQEYRVKRIPDPVPMLAGRHSQSISKDILLSAQGPEAILENFDFDAVCDIVGYTLTVVPGNADPVSMPVKGSQFPERAKKLFETLSADGIAGVYFDDIKVKCPGDAAARRVGSMAFRIKNEE